MFARTAATFCLATALIAAPAHADDTDDRSYASVVVQKRKYEATHELTLFGGVLPMDAFTKGMTGSLAYTLHFSDFIGWEVVHGFKSFHVDTDLKADLLAFELQPTPFEVANWIVTSNLVFKPIYWKGAWRNRKVIHGEMFLTAGGGYGWFTRSTRVAAALGGGARIFLGQRLSVRLDVRHHAFFNQSVFDGLSLDNELWIGLGVSLAI